MKRVPYFETLESENFLILPYPNGPALMKLLFPIFYFRHFPGLSGPLDLFT